MRRHSRPARGRLAARDGSPAVQAERVWYRHHATDRAATPEVLPVLAERDALHPNGNAARVLNLGLERPTATSSYSGGKWRLLDRQRWREHWAGPQAGVFGHYWRTPDGMSQPAQHGHSRPVRRQR